MYSQKVILKSGENLFSSFLVSDRSLTQTTQNKIIFALTHGFRGVNQTSCPGIRYEGEHQKQKEHVEKEAVHSIVGKT